MCFLLVFAAFHDFCTFLFMIGCSMLCVLTLGATKHEWTWDNRYIFVKSSINHPYYFNYIWWHIGLKWLYKTPFYTFGITDITDIQTNTEKNKRHPHMRNIFLFSGSIFFLSLTFTLRLETPHILHFLALVTNHINTRLTDTNQERQTQKHLLTSLSVSVFGACLLLVCASLAVKVLSQANMR